MISRQAAARAHEVSRYATGGAFAPSPRQIFNLTCIALASSDAIPANLGFVLYYCLLHLHLIFVSASQKILERSGAPDLSYLENQQMPFLSVQML